MSQRYHWPTAAGSWSPRRGPSGITTLCCLLVSAGVGHATPAAPAAVSQVIVRHVAGGDPAWRVEPARLQLEPEHPGVVRWQLDAAARTHAAAFAVEFAPPAPVAPAAVNAAAAGVATVGPLPANGGAGRYAYRIRLLDATGHTVGRVDATLDVLGNPGIPRIYLWLALLVGLVFLIFNYVERPLTRTDRGRSHAS